VFLGVLRVLLFRLMGFVVYMIFIYSSVVGPFGSLSRRLQRNLSVVYCSIRYCYDEL
jgi:hypothetical protein